jgi:hypothetical protein
VTSGKKVTIKNCFVDGVLKQTDSGGIVIYKQGRVELINNTIINAPYAIHLWNFTVQTYVDVLIRNNTTVGSVANYYSDNNGFQQSGVRLDMGGPIGTGNAIRDENDNELIKTSTTASAVNEITIANAATGNGPTISTSGGDTNIDLRIRPKGSGQIDLDCNILFQNPKTIQWNSSGTIQIKGGSSGQNISITGWNGSIDYQWIYFKSDGTVGFGTASPIARVHVTEATLGNEVFRLESTATNDDPNYKVYQNRVATTNASVTTLHTIAIPASTTVMIEARVVARRTGGSAGTAEDGAAYTRVACYKNSAGTATIIGAIATPVTIESQAGFDCTFTVSGGNVLLQVTGATNNNITWHATVIVQTVGS